MSKDQKDLRDLQVSYDHEAPNDLQDAVGQTVLARSRLLCGYGAYAKKPGEIG